MKNFALIFDVDNGPYAGWRGAPMKKGFALTLMTLVLFLLLVELSSSLRPYRSIPTDELATGMAVQKVIYTFDDIAEAITGLFGLNVVQNGNNLTIYDHLPGDPTLLDSLGAYHEFLNTYYATPDMNMTFLDSAGNPMNLSDVQPLVVILPYNVRYEYEDFGKRELESSCSGGVCNSSNITGIGLVFNATGLTFDWAPVPGNQSHYNWAPDNLEDCEPVNNDPKCINFTLTVRDQIGQEFSCPSAMCNHTAFPTDNKSSLDIQAAPCWFEVTLGDNNLYEVRLHAPGNPNNPCDANVDTQISYLMPSMPYFITYPVQLRINETNYNLSVRRNIAQ